MFCEWNHSKQTIAGRYRAKDLTIIPREGSCLNVAFPAVPTVSSFADFDKTTATINGERLETVRRVSRFRRFKGLTKFRESFDVYNCVNDDEKEGNRGTVGIAENGG